MRGISIISSVLGLQESSSVEIEREVRTLVWFLRETVMEDVDRGRRRRSFKERLRFKGMACCGSTWGLRPSTISVRDDDDEQEQDPQQEHHRTEAAIDPPAEGISDPGCVGQVSASSGMNLATALAAERHFRSTQYSDGSNVVGTAPGTPLRVSLMRLLEESSEGVDGGETEKEKGGGGNDSVCCVCMGRKKGSAFIPCGHTFCRVCSRELWLNRGSCPLCNRSVLEILDIF